MKTTNVLYVTYDGLTDPLGRSQILPYLMELSKSNHNIHILSCEKKERYVANKNVVLDIISNFNIEWHTVLYHKNPPILSTIIDIVNLKKKAFIISELHNIKIVHCRSYIASIIGLKLKRKHNTKFVFDMRGFFADERVDGNVWNLKNPVYRFIYNYFKKKEKLFLSESDKIVSLTQAGKKEILKMNYNNVNDNKIVIIPCCADFNHFQISDYQTKIAYRKELNIKSSQLVIGYLGSLGTWYLIAETLKLFKQIKSKVFDSKLLIISNDYLEPYKEEIAQLEIKDDDIIFINSSREKLPFYLSSIDIGVSFIKSCFSKKASSPTKIAEMLAMGIPIIINKGVGDLDNIFNVNDFGINVDLSQSCYIENLEDNITKLKQLSSEKIRTDAKALFDLITVGAKSYNNIYNELKK